MSDLMDRKLKPVEVRLTSIEKTLEKHTEDIEILKEQTKKIGPLEEQVGRLERRLEKVEHRLEIVEGKTDQIDSLADRTVRIEFLLENDVLPRLQNIESCYTSTYQRYVSEVDRVDALQADMVIVKKVVAEHSEKLQRMA